MLLSEEEVKIKSQLWFAENGDFLKERECNLHLSKDCIVNYKYLNSSTPPPIHTHTHTYTHIHF